MFGSTALDDLARQVAIAPPAEDHERDVEQQRAGQRLIRPASFADHGVDGVRHDLSAQRDEQQDRRDRYAKGDDVVFARRRVGGIVAVIVDVEPVAVCFTARDLVAGRVDRVRTGMARERDDARAINLALSPHPVISLTRWRYAPPHPQCSRATMAQGRGVFLPTRC